MAIRLLALLCLTAPLSAMEIVHGNTALQAVRVHTERALIVAGEEAAALGWEQMYVFHPAPAERKALIDAGQACGAMGVLPTGSELRLLAIARNGGALMAEILSVGAGSGTEPARGAAADRTVPTADASYPFALPPPPTARLRLRSGTRICFDTAEGLAAIPGLRPILTAGPSH